MFWKIMVGWGLAIFGAVFFIRWIVRKQNEGWEEEE
jgi:hypothetical protein